MTNVTLSPFGRRLLPSITDFLFIGLLFTRLHPTLFYDGDTAWHLWAGTWFLDHGVRAIPDSLSFTRAGVPWASPQWLGEMLFALAYRHGAYMGVALASTAAFAAAFTWLYRQLARATDHPPVAALVTILAAQASMVQLVARPVVLTMPLFVALFHLAREPRLERRAVWLGPLLTVLWANVHPSAFLAAGVLAFWAWARRSRRLAIAAALSLLALGATPWGFAWLRDLVPSGQNLGFFLRIDEWRTPGFREPRFWGLLAFLLVALLARRGRLPLPETLWGLGWLTMALMSARMSPYAVIAWAPFLAADLAGIRFLEGLRAALAPVEREVRPGLWPVLAAIVALAAAPAFAPAFPQVARGFSPARFPEAALAAADRAQLGPRVFNAYLWGGYISWARPGRYQVLIDGRAGFFGDEVLHDYLEVTELRPGWQEVLQRRAPDWILVPAQSPVATVAPLTGRWSASYSDSTAVILVHR